MRFSFTGELSANTGSNAKVPFYRSFEGNNPGHSINLIVKAGVNNRAFVEMSGFKNSVIKTYDADGNEFEVQWDDRFSEDILKKVAGYKKYVISYGDVRKEFISEYDFVKYVSDNIEELKDRKFQIVGKTSPNEYKGKITDRFKIQSMYEVTDEKKKDELKITGEFFFNKDSFDTADWKKEHKLYINGWTSEYLNKDHPNVFIAKQLVFDCSKLDFDNEQHMQILAFKLACIGLAVDESGAIVSKLKKGKYYKISVVCKYINGQETVEFKESDLSDTQKLALKLGIITMDELKPKGNIYGERVQTLKLINYDLRDDYKDGKVETEFDEDLIYSPMQNESVEKLEEVMNAPEDTLESEADDGLDSLFD